MTRLNVADIKKGMILDEDIYNEHGILIIASGSIINDKYLKILNKLNIETVRIFNDLSSNNSKIIIVDNNIQEKYNKTVESFTTIFENAKIGKKIISKEINEVLTPMLDEIKKNNDFARNLWKLEYSDEYTYNHSVKVSITSALLAKWLGYSNDIIDDIAFSGILHDIGKCNIPDEILNKPDALTDEEFKVMKTHPTLGYIMLKSGETISDNILQGVHQHHEKYDGRGYPNKYSKDEIHYFARVIGIADIYSAMTSDRVYREKMSPFLVSKLILDNSFGTLDPEMTRVFLKNISTFYIGSIIQLTDGRIGEVVMVNQNESFRPLIKLEDGFIDLSKNYSVDIKKVID